MIVSSVIMTTFNYNKNISDSLIEEKARGLGMHLESECKVMFKGDE